jgi:hypothetical protein
MRVIGEVVGAKVKFDKSFYTRVLTLPIREAAESREIYGVEAFTVNKEDGVFE